MYDQRGIALPLTFEWNERNDFPRISIFGEIGGQTCRVDIKPFFFHYERSSQKLGRIDICLSFAGTASKIKEDIGGTASPACPLD